MQKTTAAVVSVLVWLLGARVVESKAIDDRGNGTVTICHVPRGDPSHPHTIAVAPAAVAAHLAHGDSLGACRDVKTIDLLHWESTLSRFLEASRSAPRVLRIEAANGTRVISAELMGAGSLAERSDDDAEFSRLGAEVPVGGGRGERPVEGVEMSTQSLRIFNTATRLEFEVLVNGRFLQRIHEFRLAEGLTSATDGVDDPVADEQRTPAGIAGRGPAGGRFTHALWTGRVSAPGPFAGLISPVGWSNAMDTRIVRPNPQNHSAWRKIAHFSDRCTGTLIGPRHVITAAHCINKQGTNTWYDFTVTPARDGLNSQPFGSSSISDVVQPGDPFRWYFTPSQWRACSSTENCGEWDWGLIIIPDKLGNQTGWMGYVARPGSELDTQAQYNRGYPVCAGTCGSNNIDNSPPACDGDGADKSLRLYGDTNLCATGSYFNDGPDGWNRNISISCDMSGGHSGSAVYHYFFDANLGKSVPVVAMVAIQETCCFCSADTDFPNIARRITPSDLGTISFFRQWKP